MKTYLHGITQEEDGSVVVNMVPVSLLSSELDGETTGVSSSIGRSRHSSDGGESSTGSYLPSDLSEEVGAG